MLALRLAKTAFVAGIAFLVSLVAFGNITDYHTNFAFVQHVLMMDTVFPDASIKYRAIDNPTLHHAAYFLIIGFETLTAILCWIGAFRLLSAMKSPARDFTRAKNMAVIGLALGFLTWQVGFMAIGGEWFGMWMSGTWNGIASAHRFFITIIAVLIFLAVPDSELE